MPFPSAHDAGDAELRVDPANAAMPAAAAATTPSAIRIFIRFPPFRYGPEAAAEKPSRSYSETAGACGAEEAARLGLREAHALVDLLQRRLARAPRLVCADGEQVLERAFVGAQLREALLDRRQQLDDGLAHGLLQVAVARVLEPRLERVDR